MIITNNEEALRIKCEPVQDNEVGQIISLLENELANSNKSGNSGIGLAAPQIGLAKKAAIVRVNNYKINLINCSVETGYDLAVFRSEGCLSFPGRVEDTQRYQEVVVNGNLGYPEKFTVTGLLAVVCQHEIDHFNEKLFFDYKLKTKDIKPNEPCVCGKINPITNKVMKYKKCCGRNI